MSKKGGLGLITKNHRNRFCKGHIESSLIEAETVTWYPIISTNSSPFFELFKLFFPPPHTNASLSPLSLLLSLSTKCQGLRLISKKLHLRLCRMISADLLQVVDHYVTALHAHCTWLILPRHTVWRYMGLPSVRHQINLYKGKCIQRLLCIQTYHSRGMSVAVILI